MESATHFQSSMWKSLRESKGATISWFCQALQWPSTNCVLQSKCDGRQPRCSTCLAYKDRCHYDRHPSLAYVRSLEEKIDELRLELREIKAERRGAECLRWKPGCGAGTIPGEEAGGGFAIQHVADRVNKQNGHEWEAEISIDGNGAVCYHNATSAI